MEQRVYGQARTNQHPIADSVWPQWQMIRVVTVIMGCLALVVFQEPLLKVFLSWTMLLRAASLYWATDFRFGPKSGKFEPPDGTGGAS